MGSARGKGGSVSGSCVRPVGRLWAGFPQDLALTTTQLAPLPFVSQSARVGPCTSGQAPSAADWAAVSGPLAGAGGPWSSFFSLATSFPFSAPQPVLVVSGPRSAIRSTSRNLWQRSLPPAPPQSARWQRTAKGCRSCVPVTGHTNAFLSHQSRFPTSFRNGASNWKAVHHWRVSTAAQTGRAAGCHHT
jgi:hypothetical protein